VPGDECQFAYLQAGLPSGLRACAGWISSPQYQGPYRLGPGASRLRQRATPRLTATYEGWHLPLFFVLDSFRGFTPVTLPGFVLGITCGAVILTWVYNGTGGSVLLVALWHITYNMTSATEAAKGTVAAVVSTFVMVWAIALVVLELTRYVGADQHRCDGGIHRCRGPTPCATARSTSSCEPFSPALCIGC
jgi:hypothetical protein